MAKADWTKGDRRFLKVIVIVLVIGALLAVWQWWLNVTPKVTIASPPPAGDESILEAYRAAGKAVTHNAVEAAIRDHDGLTMKDRQALLTANAQALGLLRTALAHEYDRSSPRNQQVPNTRGVYSEAFRYLLITDAEVKAASEDWGAATDSYLDCLHLGCDIAAEGIDGVYSDNKLRLSGSGLLGVWKTLDHLNADEAREAASRMEGILAHQPTAVEIQHDLKQSGQAGRLAYFDKPGWRLVAVRYSGKGFAKTLAAARVMTISKRQIMDDWTVYMDEIMAEEKKPPCEQHVVRPPDDYVNRRLMDPGGPGLDSRLRNFRGSTRDILTQDRLLMVALALQAYVADNGEYPDSLSSLAPTYLQRVPDDPYARKGTFMYRHTGDTYLLYSVGRDGKDSGGVYHRNDRRKMDDILPIKPH